jgi:uncharacterized repeat protein (TIGR01451 family)
MTAYGGCSTACSRTDFVKQVRRLRVCRVSASCVLAAAAALLVMGGLHRAKAGEYPLFGTQVEAAPGAVVINEVAWAGTSASYADEWIELHNNTDGVISLEDWILEAADGTPRIHLSGTISAHGYYLLESPNDGTLADITADQTFTGALDDLGETLALRTQVGSLIDSANLDGGPWPAGAETPLYLAMERRRPHDIEADENWCSNDGITRNGQDRDGAPINGTPGARSSCYQSPVADEADILALKVGPDSVSPGATITYWITVSNRGYASAASVRVTDTLPLSVSFQSQSSSFPCTHTAGRLVWEMGEMAPSTRHTVAVTGRLSHSAAGVLTNRITATTATTEEHCSDNTSSWTTAVLSSSAPQVLISAILYDGYQIYDGDEAVEIWNVGTEAIDVTGWRVCDSEADGSCAILPAATLEENERIWLTWHAVSFTLSFGFKPGFESVETDPTVPQMLGAWPWFSNDGDEVVLKDGSGQMVDLVVYESGQSAGAGWDGPTVKPLALCGAEGQILYRKLDPDTGIPVQDTDTCASWAQDENDPIDGRRARYPGWDLHEFFFPQVSTRTSWVTMAVAPDGALGLVTQTIASAHESVFLEGYTIDSSEIAAAISNRLRAGVMVTALLEGTPAWWAAHDREKELWIAQQIDNHPNGHVLFLAGARPRYKFQHAKCILIDGRRLIVSTENLGARGMPADDKRNGTRGHRGFVAVTNDPQAIQRFEADFSRDLDIAHHTDIVPYGTPPFVLNDPTYLPLPQPDWTTYTAAYSSAWAASASSVTVIQSPENSLHVTGGLLGLINRTAAGDIVHVMQLSEPYTWTEGIGSPGLNPRMQAVVAAARDRGVTVRLLLDDYYDSERTNETTCDVLNTIARREGLSLECRLTNVTGLGMHAKAFLFAVGSQRWVHLGSINGSATASKLNREIALQFHSPELHDRLVRVFDHDWHLSHPPFSHRVYLPIVLRAHAPPADYPVISEVFINPDGLDETAEWVELYNPGQTVDVGGWILGDALSAGDYGDGRYTLPVGTTLLHGQVIVCASCASDFAQRFGRNPEFEISDCSPSVPDMTPAGGWDGFGVMLGNREDEVLLWNSRTGRLVDAVAWGGAPRAGVQPFKDFEPPFPSGASLKRYPPHQDRDDCSADFYVSFSPSPGLVAGS